MADPKRILVVGVGSIGERHVRCFQATGRALVSICEINDALRERVAKRYAIAESFGSLDDALTVEHDGAVVCTPADQHVAIATQVANARINVLIEKPLSTELAGVRDLQATLEARDVVGAVAYVFRIHPALADMRAALHSRRFGRPLQVIGTVGQHFPTHRPAYREIYYADRRMGGGAIQDGLTHTINAAEWLVGPVDAVTADASHLALPGVEVEDTVHVLARHGPIMACYSLNQHQAPNELTLTIVCERGTVRFDLYRRHWRWMIEPGGEWHDEPITQVERDALFAEQARRFLDVMTRQAKPACSIEEGMQSVRVSLAILRSSESRVWESV